MSYSTIRFFPVDNGNMTLIKLNDANSTTILIDMYIRGKADDPNHETFDVAEHLRSQLESDKSGRPFIDVLVLTHNDGDHITGFEKHFHLGKLDDYTFAKDGEEDPIIIHEMWSSSRFWKHASDDNILCSDAKAFNREMKRRVKLFEDSQTIQAAGDRALIIGEDPDGKTDNLGGIVKKVDESFSRINEKSLASKLNVYILGPIEQQENEEDEDYKESNRGSIILQFKVIESGYSNQIMLTGDANVFVWECLWNKFSGNTGPLKYDILQSPHHCSWRSLSNDSESQSDDPKVSSDAKSALSQTISGAYIVASSKPIKDDGQTPPSYLAKLEYESMIDKSHFLCTGEYPKESAVEPIIFELTSSGPRLQAKRSTAKSSAAAIGSTKEAYPHG